MSSNYDKVKNFRKHVKVVAVQTMGNACQICGYDRCIQALELHHINPDEKEISFSVINSWDTLYAELAKAILVCANCHREIHYNNLPLPTEFTRFDPVKADSMRNSMSHNAERKHVDREYRIRVILSSDIDYSKRGWGARLAQILGINSANANRWVKVNMPDFYESQCYKY